MSTGLKNERRIVAMFCPLGLLIAILAHLILIGVCVALAVSGQRIYWGSVLGYGQGLRILMAEFCGG